MSEKKLAFASIVLVSVTSTLIIFALYDSQVSGIVVHPKINGTMQVIIIPYFAPTSYLWQTVYEQADKYPGTIKYVIVNPCSGPCDKPLGQDWQDVIATLRGKGIKTLGYIFNTTENFNGIDYYMKSPQVPTDGIFFDNEGSANTAANFKQYADYVHRLGGIVYINPGYDFGYLPDYLKSGEADVANIHEIYSNSSDKISPNTDFSPWQTSVIIGNVTSSQEMQADLSNLASKGFGTVYIYKDSYGELPEFFTDEIAKAAATKVQIGR